MRHRMRSGNVFVAVGIMGVMLAACSGGTAENEPTESQSIAGEPAEEASTADSTPSEGVEEETSPEASDEPEAEHTPIPHAGEVVELGPDDVAAYYDFDQDFDYPPHVADMRVVGLEWDFVPGSEASALCEYDADRGRYLAVRIDIESNEKARSYGTPFSGQDFRLTDDEGEVAGEYFDWDSRACTRPELAATVALNPNTMYTGTWLFVVEPQATELRVDFFFDSDDVAPVFVWTLADF